MIVRGQSNMYKYTFLYITMVIIGGGIGTVRALEHEYKKRMVHGALFFPGLYCAMHMTISAIIVTKLLERSCCIPKKKEMDILQSGFVCTCTDPQFHTNIDNHCKKGCSTWRFYMFSIKDLLLWSAATGAICYCAYHVDDCIRFIEEKMGKKNE